ncbi:MAG: hypothetical protein VXB01_04100 [Opitutae bacterium]
MRDLIRNLARRGLIKFSERRGRGRPAYKTDSFEAVHDSARDLGISEACRIHKVSRQGYYYWMRRRHG